MMDLSLDNIELWAEDFRAGKLSAEQRRCLEKKMNEDDAFNKEWHAVNEFLDLLEEKRKQDHFRAYYQASIQKDFSKPNHEEKQHRLYPVFSFNKGKNFLKTTGIAAALVVATALTTFWITNNVRKDQNDNQYTLLRREIEHIKTSQSQIRDSLSLETKTPVEDAKYGGTGFAISNNGYLATNYHVVRDANSIYVQTRDSEIYKAYLVTFDPQSDVAVLKIEDPKFKFSRVELPYDMINNLSGLGQRVFTMGYPEDDLVYNEGYISREKGFDNDSTSYQLEMTANPGQSGAPVLDKNGNVIALVTGKESNSSGTTFAVHTKALLNLIGSLPETTQKEIKIPRVNHLKNLDRIHQVKTMEPFICSVKVN